MPLPANPTPAPVPPPSIDAAPLPWTHHFRDYARFLARAVARATDGGALF